MPGIGSRGESGALSQALEYPGELVIADWFPITVRTSLSSTGLEQPASWCRGFAEFPQTPLGDGGDIPPGGTGNPEFERGTLSQRR